MKNSFKSLLEDDHGSLDVLLTELEAELAKTDNARAFELLDLFWARLAVHIRAENLHLFPALTNAAPALFTSKGSLPTSDEAKNVVARLRSDHEFFMKELALMVKAMRETSGSQAVNRENSEELRRRMTVIKNRLKAHNRLEEEQVYTWPSLLFDEKTIADLRESLRQELENLPSRFEKT